MKRDLLIAGALILLAGLGIGVVVALPWLQDDEAQQIVKPRTEPIAQVPKKEEPTKPAPPAKKEPIVLAKMKEKQAETTTPFEKKTEPEPTKKIDEKKAPVKVEPTPKKIEVKIEPKVEVKVEVKKRAAAKIITIGDDLIKLNDPQGEYAVKPMHRGMKIKLIGAIQTLKIADANEGSVLDLSGLHADEIVFTGNVNSGSTVILGKARSIKIRDVNDRSTVDASASEARDIALAGAVNSGSTVKLAAVKGSIEILGEINDRAQIDIAAPDGKVVFKSRGESVINGGARLTIVAKDVEFGGAINGGQTQVNVTLTRDGSLKFRRVNRGVRLLWNKANSGDPAPRIEPGPVDGAAVFRMEPAGKK